MITLGRLVARTEADRGDLKTLTDKPIGKITSRKAKDNSRKGLDKQAKH